MSKQSRRPNRRNRGRDWFGRPNVAFYCGWYKGGPEHRAEARRQCTELLMRLTPGADPAEVEWLEYGGADARLFLAQAIREAHSLELLGHYQMIGDLIRTVGGRVVIATVPAGPAGEGTGTDG